MKTVLFGLGLAALLTGCQQRDEQENGSNPDTQGGRPEDNRGIGGTNAAAGGGGPGKQSGAGENPPLSSPPQ